MSKRRDEIETEPHQLDDGPSGSRAQAGGRTFAGTVADFFRKSGGANAQESMIAKARQIRQASVAAQSEPMAAKSTLFRHWDAIRADGITATEFIAFLQPLADLDGITVSYIYSDEDGTEHVYNHRRGEFGIENPLSRAIQEKKLSKEKALTFALNEEGRVWIESNFMELSDLK
ncbi:hypothetical protein [Variovorax guangxiensis]|uniref:hypothetical protein n=1 Tax=Variovorax guangxiensis TaxID=1775474 RepID=UPI002854CEF8|nr:hypothetical protein [Variovorax guangxiensis]MDR6856220.1 hypothetical protein [Variovorax guangxiensis]